MVISAGLTYQFGGLRQTVSFRNLLIGGIAWQWSMLFFDKIEIFLMGFSHCELSCGFRLNEVSRPVFALALDAGPVGADRWLWLARDARSLDPLKMACDVCRVNALALVESHLAGGIASIFSLRTKSVTVKAKKYFTGR